MSSSPPSRRAVAELRSRADRPAWATIGSRSIHQFWHLLAPHFRGVLLAPQRRPDGGGVSWSWREPNGSGPLTAMELADVRRKLKGGERSFAGGLAARPQHEAQGEGDGAGDPGSQLLTSIQAMVAKLTGMTDPVLGGFVCRTESGPMMHSWGAAAPTQPYFPDTLNCEISGTVHMGGESAAGLKLVIENRQGAILARAQTEASGAFRFQKIGAGSYRIRVTGRGDFPASGFAVEVEHESVTGLELHRGAAVATFARASSRSQPTMAAAAGEATDPAALSEPAVSGPSRPDRRRVALLIAVLVLVAGGGWWLLGRRPAGSGNRGGATFSGWQAASGPVAGASEQAASAEVRWEPESVRGPVGASAAPARARDSSRNDISVAGARASLALPNEERPPLSSLPESSPGEGAALAAMPAATTAGGEGLSAGNAPPMIDQGKSVRGGSSSPEGITPEEKGITEDPEEPVVSSANPVSSAVKDAAGRSAQGSTPSRRNGGSTNQGTAGGLATAGASGSASGGVANGTSTASGASGSPRGKQTAAAAGKAKGREALSAASGVAAAASNHAASASSSEPSTAADAAASPDRQANSRPMRAENARTAAASSADEPPASAATDEAKSGSPTTDSASKRTAAKSRRVAPRQREPSAATAPPTPPAALPLEPAGEPSAAAAAAEEPASTPAPPTAAVEGKAAKSAAPANPRAPTAPLNVEAAAERPTRPVPVNKKSLARANTPRANRPPAAANRSPPAEPPEDTPGENASARSLPKFFPGKPGGAEPGNRLAISVSEWETRLVLDVILPTHPILAGEDDAVEVTRERLLRDRQARMPPALRRPVITCGFALEFPPESGGPDQPPQWRDAGGAQPVGTNVRGDRAEVSWPGVIAPRGMQLVLIHPNGRELARVSVDSDGVPNLMTVGEVRTWFWVGVEGAAANEAPGPIPVETVPRFQWRLRSGAPVPLSWRQDDHWRGGRGCRIDLPFVSGTTDRAIHALALVDPATGWAVVGEIVRR